MDKRDFLKKFGAGATAALMIPGTAWADAAAQTTASISLTPVPAGKGGKLLIAHRGASSYSPENTLPAYEMAIEQGSDLVEQDLQITKDGVLICMHDNSLEATTNVEEVFPDRFSEKTVRGKKVKTWPIYQFTLAEIKQLKAGSRKEGQFPATTVPTWQEAIDLIRGRAGLCPETKGPEYYSKLGFDMEKLVAETLRKNGLDKLGRDKKTPILMQSFSTAGLQRLQKNGIDHPMLLLSGGKDKNAAAGIDTCLKNGFSVIGPYKKNVTADLVKKAHAAGVKVIPYTFQPEDMTKGYTDLKTEMSHYLYELGIDGLFTNNPDLFPRQKV